MDSSINRLCWTYPHTANHNISIHGQRVPVVRNRASNKYPSVKLLLLCSTYNQINVQSMSISESMQCLCCLYRVQVDGQNSKQYTGTFYHKEGPPRGLNIHKQLCHAMLPYKYRTQDIRGYLFLVSFHLVVFLSCFLIVQLSCCLVPCFFSPCCCLLIVIQLACRCIELSTHCCCI